MPMATDYEKPQLLLLLEALQREQAPSGARAARVTVSEYTADVARHAKECLPELLVLAKEGALERAKVTVKGSHRERGTL